MTSLSQSSLLSPSSSLCLSSLSSTLLLLSSSSLASSMSFCDFLWRSIFNESKNLSWQSQHQFNSFNLGGAVRRETVALRWSLDSISVFFVSFFYEIFVFFYFLFFLGHFFRIVLFPRPPFFGQLAAGARLFEIKVSVKQVKVEVEAEVK